MGPQIAGGCQPSAAVAPDITAAHLAAIVASSFDAIVSKNLVGTVLSWNAEAERMFGYSAAEMIGQSITRIIPPEHMEEETHILEQLRRGQRIERYETVRVRKDGRRLNVGLTISPIRDATGTIVAASKVIRDISERKRAEAQFEILADLMPAMCWMANADGGIFWYNRRWYEYTGTTPEQMQGWGWQSVHDPALLPDVLERWKASIETGELFEMTFPLRGIDGVFHPFLTRITPVRGSDGLIFRWLGVNTDITEERMASELREQFMAVLGHDLRNPLTAIMSGLTLLRKTPLNDRAILLANLMRDSAFRMEALIEDIMDLARCRLGGGLTLNRRVAEDLEPVLRHVIAELSVAWPGRIVEVDCALNKPVTCDKGRIAQLFSNLLSNALTYGSVDRPVRVRAVSSTEGLEFSVKNHGKPISAADLPRLFQPFYRGGTRPSRQGLGLGLYIASEIATAHGGTLDVASADEEICFTFRMRTI